ncbi:hypothetical protein F511_26023 [Dorcoceras hygrometricum]|uniref:Uncharacterized protein n=1 Tax=Dorcoceras hygrometricum TaxID=472368 RepID=A0A2Z7DB40_9LAMI|nr:hypothetical protein F511_26023 [Dorcoceras hygrometricum]
MYAISKAVNRKQYAANLFLKVQSSISYISPSSIAGRFTKRFDLYNHLYKIDPTACKLRELLAHSAAHQLTGYVTCLHFFNVSSTTDYAFKLSAYAPTHTWALAQLIHQLLHACTSSRLLHMHFSRVSLLAVHRLFDVYTLCANIFVGHKFLAIEKASVKF